METSNSRFFTRIDVLVAIGLVGFASLVALPAIHATRESARRTQCASNLRQIGVAMQGYLDAHQSLPYAARWTSEGLDIEKIDQEPWTGHATYENWVQSLLPYLGQGTLSDSFDRAAPITGESNAKARAAELPLMRCPADSFNRPDNHYNYAEPEGARADFARGDYAINGGSQAVGRYPGRSSAPAPEAPHYVFDRQTKSFQMWGNGVAGINKSFGRDDFTNGSSTLVAVNEVRAGIHTIDPRGTWALGMIGASITFAHGVTGDDAGPNKQGERADDILDCKRLHQLLGKETLMRENMPCCSYWNISGQATSRSLHTGGVNTLMMDGAVRFLSDDIDPSVWHVLHSRETPPGVIDESSIDAVRREPTPPPAPKGPRDDGPGRPAVPRELPLVNVVNSVGMELTLIPQGEFIMGTPDVTFDKDVPPECPPHRVRITKPYYLGTHEVTQEQFARIMGKNPSWHTTSSGLKDKPEQDTGLLPVEQVSWNDAVEFCHRLSQQPAEKDAGLVYRLPTEAEWEFACRSGKSDPFLWKFAAPDPMTGENAGETLPGNLDVVAVGSYPPNAFGVYDMRGNVYEWCADWFARDYYHRSPVDDPPGPTTGYLRVVRGGDWLFVGEGCMINRRITLPWQSNPYIGFRVAASADRLPTKVQPAPVSDRALPLLAIYSSHRNPKWMELIKLEPERRSATLLKASWSVSPSWSPDGRRIAFAEAKADIWIMDADGANLQNLTNGDFKFTKSPTWSLDGTRIAFSATKDDKVWSLFVIDDEGRHLQPLVKTPGQQMFPAWSPDGKQILFELTPDNKSGRQDLVVTDAAGTAVRTVREAVSYAAAPSWLPDSNRFVFTDWGKTKEQLKVVIASVDGSVVSDVTAGDDFDLFPVCSSDGRFIAYVHFDSRKDPRGDLVIYDVRQNTHRVVSKGTLISGEDSRPAWRPQAGR
jgi:formylglycine-generating enzyme required for sulfatase activity/Tol biopolymer transport system component/type II secretory pathway pseudopilin PulG